jgi:hypothetical protein
MTITARTASLAAAALLAAGCGSRSPGNATTGQRPGNFVSAAFAYARCMRNHGVTSFPDPKVSISPGRTAVGFSITPATSGTALFKSADESCRRILPGPPTEAQRRARTQDLLSFARCMRGRGIGSFPDPSSQGELSAAAVRSAGIDLHSPAVLAAAKACIPAAHGAISAADVNRAVNGGQ